MKKVNKIRITDQWYDDGCPCFNFEYKGVMFGLSWTSPEVGSALEYYNDSPKARKKIADFIRFIEHPDLIENDDEDDGSGKITCYSDWGCLQFTRPGTKLQKKGR